MHPRQFFVFYCWTDPCGKWTGREEMHPMIVQYIYREFLLMCSGHYIQVSIYFKCSFLPRQFQLFQNLQDQDAQGQAQILEMSFF